VKIRVANIDDVHAIAAFLDTFEDEREYFDATSREEVKAGMRKGDVWFVGEEEASGAIVGTVCVYRDRLDDNYGRIGQLGVARSLRGGPHGADLMRTAEDYLYAQQCPGVMIGVLDFKGPRLVQHYRQMGYVEVGRGEPDPPPKRRCRMIIMSKTLA
jgi:N-acetylglutamate synthase-like GNAT family acetyltransferase